MNDIFNKSEGKTLEFKREINKPDRFLQTVSSFSNTAGGDIWIGIDDKTRKIIGITDPLKAEERIANLISDGISPKILPNIEIVSVDSLSLIRVQIFPGSSRPYFVSSLGLEKGSYIRIGSTNRLADDTLIQEMRRMRQGLSFDELPFYDAGIECLDESEVKKYLGPKLSSEKILENFKLIVMESGKRFPSNGGIILFGKNREDHFPDALIKVGIFEGIDKSKVKEWVEFKQYPIEAIDRSLNYILEQIKLEFDFSKIQRQIKYILPPEVLREALINSFTHADYSIRGTSIRVSIFKDRIEIENPGILLLGLTLQDIQNGVSKVRNKVIARYFEKAGLIEQWGSGIQRMNAACAEAGFPPPVFEELGHHFRVTLSLQKMTSNKLTLSLRENKLLGLLKLKPMGTKEIATKLKVSERTVRSLLEGLQKKNLLGHTGKSPLDPNKKFFVR